MARQPDHAMTLMAKARDDAYAVERAIGDSDFPDWVIGFHAQQAIEKAIKAVLTARGVDYPPTHDLEHLFELMDRTGIPAPPAAKRLLRLTPFASVHRYESVADEALPLDRPWALACVREVLDWAEGQLQ